MAVIIKNRFAISFAMTMFFIFSPVTAQQLELNSVIGAVGPNEGLKNPEISYSDLIALLSSNEIAEVSISRYGGALDGVRKDGTTFSVLLSQQSNIADRLVDAGVEVKFVTPTLPNVEVSAQRLAFWAIADALPWLMGALIILLVFWLVNLMNRGPRRRREKLIELQERALLISEKQTASIISLVEESNRQVTSLLEKLERRVE